MIEPDTLAERFRDPKRDAYSSPDARGFRLDNSVVRAAMLEAKRYVLADSACRLAVQLSNRFPLDIERMLESIELPAPAVWIEMGSRCMLDERLRLGTIPEIREARPPSARTAMLVKDRGDGTIQSWCIEDGVRDYTGKVIAWPLSYLISLYKPVQAWQAVNTAAHWGYGAGTPYLTALNGRAVATIFARRIGPEGEAILQTELMGWTRLTVATLAMFCSVASIETVERKPGHIRIGGAMRPHLKSDKLVIVVPKRIRKPSAWAMEAIKKAAGERRRRQHDVSAHMRHLTYQPRALGWEPIIIGNRLYYQKQVKAHKRGDRSLGVVEHRETHVIARPLIDPATLRIIPPESVQ